MIDISNIINISVLAPGTGIAPYSINNLLCLTKDTPAVSLDGDDYALYTNAADVITQWGSGSGPADAATALFSQSPNIISGGGVFIVAPMASQETMDTAITRLAALVFFGGVSYDFSADAAEVLDAAAVAQASRKLLFVVSSTSSDLDGSNGLLYKISNQSLSYTRGLYYSDSAGAQAFKWAYAGRGLSTNFSAVNTTSTMQLKQLATVDADEDLTAAYLAKAAAVGADVYINLAGRASLMSYGVNGFYDDVYNLAWFIGALEVAGFNRLAQVGTKIPQTETGMNLLKNAYQTVCDQAVTNAFVGPGAWSSADTFGSPEDFRRNISSKGYYIYSAPVASQLSADRLLRKAVPIQIAIKYQGAIHKSDVIIFVNA